MGQSVLFEQTQSLMAESGSVLTSAPLSSYLLLSDVSSSSLPDNLAQVTAENCTQLGIFISFYCQYFVMIFCSFQHGCSAEMHNVIFIFLIMSALFRTKCCQSVVFCSNWGKSLVDLDGFWWHWMHFVWKQWKVIHSLLHVDLCFAGCDFSLCLTENQITISSCLV